MEQIQIFTDKELQPIAGLDASAYADRRAAFSATTTTVSGAQLNTGFPRLLEIAVTNSDRAETSWRAVVRLSEAVGMILRSRASLSVGRWGLDARLAIVLDASAAADTACQEAIVGLLTLGYLNPSTTIVRADPPTTTAPDLFVSTADSKALDYAGLHRLRTGLAARHKPEVLSLDEAIDVAQHSFDVIAGNRHAVADHRRFIGVLKALRRAQSKCGEIGRMTPEVLERFRRLSERLVDDDSARLTTQLIFELPSD